MELLEALIGKKVSLLTDLGGTEKQEIGILLGAKGHLVQLEKENGEVFFYSVYLIRSIKQFGR